MQNVYLEEVLMEARQHALERALERRHHLGAVLAGQQRHRIPVPPAEQGAHWARHPVPRLGRSRIVPEPVSPWNTFSDTVVRTSADRRP